MGAPEAEKSTEDAKKTLEMELNCTLVKRREAVKCWEIAAKMLETTPRLNPPTHLFPQGVMTEDQV